MVKNWNRVAILLFIIILSASACVSGDTRSTGNEDRPGIYILDLDAVQASSGKNTTLANVSNIYLDSTATSAPTETVSPTLEGSEFTLSATEKIETAKPTEDKSAQSSAPDPTVQTCVNKAEFLKHLSISDNTALEPGVSFGKVWLIKNVGTCTWTPLYHLIFMSGESMQGYESYELPYDVKPGETLELRISLIAPMQPDIYLGEWMLQDEFGGLFGVGLDGNEPLRVQILVRLPVKFESL